MLPSTVNHQESLKDSVFLFPLIPNLTGQTTGWTPLYSVSPSGGYWFLVRLSDNIPIGNEKLPPTKLSAWGLTSTKLTFLHWICQILKSFYSSWTLSQVCRHSPWGLVETDRYLSTVWYSSLLSNILT